MDEKGKAYLKHWVELQETLDRGDFVGMDAYFHPDFRYVNPSRPDLNTFAEWKKSPMALYQTFSPQHYVTTKAVCKGDDLWVFCVNDTWHTGGVYMGAEPKGGKMAIEWFSIVTFKDGLILRIFSIADVLGMLVQCGALDKSMMTVAPHGAPAEREAAIAALGDRWITSVEAQPFSAPAQ